MKKEDVKKVLNRYVMYEGHKYKVLRYEAWKDEKGVLYHSLCLYDGRHTIVTAPIERIELIEESSI